MRKLANYLIDLYWRQGLPPREGGDGGGHNS
jgi:hypothetical protein